MLVQSEKAPEWVRAELLGACLAKPAACKAFQPEFCQGQLLYFRLRANPTVKRDGKRLGLLQQGDQVAWLRRKAEQGGFSVVSCTVVPEGLCKDAKGDGNGGNVPLAFLSVRFEGVLRVEQPSALLPTIRDGVGCGKGLGFGLLSVAPLRG